VVAPGKKGEAKKLETREGKGAGDQKRPGKPKSVVKKEVSVETQNYVGCLDLRGCEAKTFPAQEIEDRVKESPMAIAIKGAIQSILGKSKR